MTPLGGSLWRLIADPNLTPDQRHEGAWDLWRGAPLASVQLVSKFSAAAMRPLWEARTSQAPTPAPDPEPEMTAPVGRKRALEVGNPVWGVLMGMMASLDIRITDPVLDAEIASVASACEGDAVFMFGYYGEASIRHCRTWWSPEELQASLLSIEALVKQIDTRLFGESEGD